MNEFPQPGEMFAGYRLESELGRGGFATVFRASNPQGVFALKVLVPGDDGAYEPSIRARTMREIEALSSLKNPHVVRLFGHGEDRGLIFMVFELLPGQSLASLLEHHPRLAPAEVTHIVNQVLIALEEAHAAGVLHRDLKPDNIHIVPTPLDPLFVKLLDFGIARALDAHHPSVTRTGEMIGTPRYMSPEQLTGKPLTAASDIYSLGMVAFEMLMGQEHMPGYSLGAQLDRMQANHVFSLEGLPAGEPIAAAVQRMTDRDPARRPQTANGARRLLTGVATVQAPPPAEPPPTTGRSITSLAIGAVVLLMAVSLTAGIAFSKLTQEPSPQPPALPAAKTERANPFAEKKQEPTPNTPQTVAQLPPDGCGSDIRGGRRDAGATVVVAPSKYDSSKRHKLVLMVHDNYQKPGSWVDETGFEKHAIGGRFVVVAPSDFKMPFGVDNWSGRDSSERLRSAVEWAKETYCLEDQVAIVAQGSGVAPALELRCEPWVSGFVALGYAPDFDSEEPFCANPAPTLWMRPTSSRYLAEAHGGADCRGFVQWGPAKIEEALRSSHACKGDRQDASHEDCRTWSCEVPLEVCEVGQAARWTGSGKPNFENFTPACEGDEPSTFPMTDESFRFLKL